VVVADRPDTSDKPISEQMRVYTDGSNLFVAQTAQGAFVQMSAEDAQNRITEAKSAYRNAAAQAQKAQRGHTASPAQGPSAAPAGPGAAPPDFTSMESPKLDPDDLVTVLFNPELKTSWVMVPGLIGLILLFIGTVITSIGLVRERETGTLEQLAVMPLRPSSIILGKIVPYFMVAVVDMAVVTMLGVWLFGVPFNGSLWLFSLAALIFLFVVLGIGVFISSISQNTGQAIQMAILFMVPQVLLSGLIFPLTSMPLGVRWIGYALPLTWFREIAQGIMLRSVTLEGIWLPFVILAAMAVVVFGAATARMRYILTHGGAR
jgi:ABC transporter, permease protein